MLSSIHDVVIQESGGLGGHKDIGQLESVLEHIQNDDYYPTFIDKKQLKNILIELLN